MISRCLHRLRPGCLALTFYFYKFQLFKVPITGEIDTDGICNSVLKIEEGQKRFL